MIPLPTCSRPRRVDAAGIESDYGPAAGVTTSIAGDLNGDSYVNVGDLQILVAAWGSDRAGGSSWNAAADANSDGYVNVGDLQTLVANWGRSL